jgi:hypothetical protein
MTRKYQYLFSIECEGEGNPDLAEVENLIDLTMQELVYDDTFVSALDEKVSVTIQVIPLLDNQTEQKG